ncbi:MAG: hypothetical protein J0L94_01495 [Rhodothermia bacterium]|nr:hypothetical protein [Rhodothermia bacterium]
MISNGFSTCGNNNASKLILSQAPNRYPIRISLTQPEHSFAPAVAVSSQLSLHT